MSLAITGAVVGITAGLTGIGVTANNLINAPNNGDGNPTYVNSLRRDYYNANGGITNIPTYGNQAQAQRGGIGQNVTPPRGGTNPGASVPLSSQTDLAASVSPLGTGGSFDTVAIALGVLALGAAIFLHRKK